MPTDSARLTKEEIIAEVAILARDPIEFYRYPQWALQRLFNSVLNHLQGATNED